MLLEGVWESNGDLVLPYSPVPIPTPGVGGFWGMQPQGLTADVEFDFGRCGAPRRKRALAPRCVEHPASVAAVSVVCLPFAPDCPRARRDRVKHRKR